LAGETVVVRLDRGPPPPEPVTVFAFSLKGVHSAGRLVRQSHYSIWMCLEIEPPRRIALVPAASYRGDAATVSPVSTEAQSKRAPGIVTTVTDYVGVIMPKRGLWVLLSYRLPREPSTPRIGLWRRLRRLGVAQLHDGLVGLPLDARNREQLEWIAQDVIDTGGEASIWLAEPTTDAQERKMVAQMMGEIASEYRGVIKEAIEGKSEPEGVRKRTLKRLRRELRRIRQRDYFPPAESEKAHSAVNELAALQEAKR
jgi:hypothetical protein